MTRQDVLEKTKRIIFDCFQDMEEAGLEENSVINTETAIDSMGFVLVICKLEALFDVKIPERQWKKLQTLGDVVDAIYKRLPNKA
ncbi:MAG: acyl carrier protein [Oscillospiraceae bacterium]|nr:acyl carrier protein [Oscillospiraceae bacterium]